MTFDYREYASKNFYLDKGLSNFVNLGNTCYINSSLVAVFNCLGLTHFFLGNEALSVVKGEDNYKKNEYPFLTAYVKTLSAYFEKNRKISPKTLILCLNKLFPEFVNGRQQDAYSCLLNILDSLHLCLSYKKEFGPIDTKIHRDLLESKKEYHKHFTDSYSIIIDLFFGQTLQKISCNKCKKVSKKYEPFMGLNLSLIEDKPIVTIYDLLDKYFSGNLEKNCENCKTTEHHTTSTKIIKLPKYLIIQMKRFKSDLSKISKMVAYGSTIEMSDYSLIVDGCSMEYELMSVINHSGNSLNSGHYYTFNRTFAGKWVCIDDDNVAEIKATDVCNENAYVLVYELNEF